MDYGYDGSGTQTYYVADALRYNFGYRNGVNYKYRDNGATTEENFEHYYENDSIWSRMLIEDLDMKRPLIYSGHPSSGAGHAWVCDGYRTDAAGATTFHMNWGWGGSGDGYFSIDNLNTHAGPGDDSSYNFVYGQCVIFNIAVPDLEAAPYCMNNQTSVYEEEHWNINDGSYSNLYKNNTDCDWVIKINDYQTDTLLLYFNYFELEAGDELKIYSGEDANGQLLYTFYDGNEPTDSIKHSGTPLYIHFTSDGEDQARGWELHYEAMRYPYTITTSVVGTGGTVSPAGVTPVMKNSSMPIVMTPNPGYTVSEFTIDGVLTLKGSGLDEEIGYYISPNSFFIKLFDCLMFFFSLIYFIFIPYFLSQNYFILKNNNVFTIILLFIDVLYIIDIIINFFRAYKNFDEKIIKRTRKIISHYLKTLFLLDLIQAFPYFSLLHFLKQKYNFSIVKNFIPNMKVWQEN